MLWVLYVAMLLTQVFTFHDRHRFFEVLTAVFRRTSVNGLKMIFGDLNARLQRRLPGEEQIIGEHVFGDVSRQLDLNSNRELLVELCECQSLAIANTFFDHTPDAMVTFRRQGVAPNSPDLSSLNFGQLDFVLIRQCNLFKIFDVRSYLSEAPS